MQQANGSVIPEPTWGPLCKVLRFLGFQL